MTLVARGDERAFDLVVKKYSTVIYPYLLYWLKQPHLAEEVAQDIFVRLWKNRSKLADVDNFSGYLYRIARNRALSELKRKVGGPEGPSTLQLDPILNDVDAGITPHTGNTPHSELELKELAAILQQAIEALPPRRKAIFLLSRTKEMTYEQIAAELGISRSTVREHMVEALVFLRQYLKQHAGIIFLKIFFIGPVLQGMIRGLISM